jgi:D-aminoacyl-tRNA deacylase
MRCVIQRVEKASVTVNGSVSGSIDKGLLIYCAIKDGDSVQVAKKMASKIVNMRIFPDEKGVMNISLVQKQYSCLLVSQFTLYADLKHGNRPFYGNAANPVFAKNLLNEFEMELKKSCKCETGVFGALMHIESVNDGPVTIIIDSEEFNN